MLTTIGWLLAGPAALFLFVSFFHISLVRDVPTTQAAKLVAMAVGIIGGLILLSQGVF
jgi:hypothetical protein